MEKVTLRCASLDDCSDTDLITLLDSFIYLHFSKNEEKLSLFAQV